MTNSPKAGLELGVVASSIPMVLDSYGQFVREVARFLVER